MSIPYLRPWPEDKPLRDWQRNAIFAFESHPDPDFLCAATPAAGKTTFALRLAHQLLTDRRAERMVVVVPTDNLREQWLDKANRVGIKLQTKFGSKNYVESKDQHGAVFTYAQIANNAAAHNTACQRRTLVIFDEPHHAGDSLTWGNSIRQAFEHAIYRVSITGTPFRSDNNPIPFITYVNGKSRLDFSYNYGTAVQEKVCRPVYFPTYEGTMTWWTSASGEMTARFADELSEADQRRRMRTAVDPGGEFLPLVIRDANDKLTDIRLSIYSRAAGLILASGQGEAREIADLLGGMTGDRPVVAVSEDPDASDIIKRFKDSDTRWIIAVRMVSEGVDIPRLFVVVYATHILTEMFFLQAIGRALRWMENTDLPEQPAYAYVPRDPYLLEYMRHVCEMREHALAPNEDDAPIREYSDDGCSCTGQREQTVFSPLDARGEASTTFTYDGEELLQEEIAAIRYHMVLHGVKGVPDELARLFRAVAQDLKRPTGQSTKMPSESVSDIPLEVEKQNIGTKINNMVQGLCMRLNWEHKRTNGLINRACGIRTREKGGATLQEMKLALALAGHLLSIARSSGAGDINDWEYRARQFVNEYRSR